MTALLEHYYAIIDVHGQRRMREWSRFRGTSSVIGVEFVDQVLACLDEGSYALQPTFKLVPIGRV